MARYPTFDEYRKRGNYQDGLKRCDDLLKKNPHDVQLLILKFQLLSAIKGDAQPVLDQLASRQPPIWDLGDIVSIEDAVEISQRDDYPSPNSAGPSVAKLWDNAFKASTSMNHKLDLLSLRFSRAIVDNRLADAQQALIQLKALQPKNRVVYMAHAAVTQMLSTANDDLSARLALLLARKAVTDKFDADDALDCRVPGQIFALQASQKDLENISDTRFKESKQVYEALRDGNRKEVNGDSAPQAEAGAASWDLSGIPSLKQHFADLTKSSASLDTVLAFATNSLQLFHTASTSTSDPRGRGAADACFLSISALTRAYELSSDQRYLLTAAFSAEALLKHNPHIHEARLILIYLYMRLGLGSLALHYFDSLNIKEIQHDTVGHVLFTNLSLTHPHITTVKRNAVFEPLKRLSLALAMYTKHEERLAETEASVLNHSQTGMLIDLRELRDHLRLSVTRRITYLEQRRTARLLNNALGQDAAPMGPKVLANWTNVVDNRDFAAAFDFGYNVERVLSEQDGSRPGKQWILRTLAADSAWCLASGHPTLVKDVDALVSELASLEPSLDRLEINKEESQVRPLDSLAGNLANQTLRTLLHLASNDPELPQAAAAMLKALERLPITKLLDTTDILAEHLTAHYNLLDVLRTVLKASKLAREKAKEQHDLFDTARKLAEEHCTALRDHAKEQSKRVSAAAVREYVQREERLKDSIGLLGDGNLADFCQAVAASAKEGWEGVTKIN